MTMIMMMQMIMTIMMIMILMMIMIMIMVMMMMIIIICELLLIFTVVVYDQQMILANSEDVSDGPSNINVKGFKFPGNCVEKSLK